MSMSYFADLISEHLKNLASSKYQLVESIVNKDSMPSPQHLYSVLGGKRRPTDSVLSIIAAVDWLGLNVDTLRAWRALDEYPLEQLEQAVAQALAMRQAGQTAEAAHPKEQSQNTHNHAGDEKGEKP